MWRTAMLRLMQCWTRFIHLWEEVLLGVIMKPGLQDSSNHCSEESLICQIEIFRLHDARVPSIQLFYPADIDSSMFKALVILLPPKLKIQWKV
jgi:hypothetical protein